jgi:hypothetical protein
MRDRSAFFLAALSVLLLPGAARAQVSCAGLPAFQSCTAYASGAAVVYNSAKYTSIAPIPATRDCPPNSPYNPSNDNWWTNNGACSGGAATATTGATATRTSTATATRTATPTPTAGGATATVTRTSTATATATRTSTATATPTSGGGTTVNVSTASQLSAALNNAVAGQTIQLASGTYVGTFTLARSGTASARITITGPATAVIQGTSVGGGYGLHLDHSSYATVRGITLTNAQKGIICDGVTNVLIDGVTVHDVGMEGIHLRSFSSNNTIQNAHVFSTGLSSPGFGEGLYVGSANSNWASYSGGQPDASNSNQLLNNTLGPNVAAECIDIKEGTTGGLVQGNHFDSTGITGQNFADSWIDVKGNGWQIVGNTGTNPSGSLLVDGIQTHVQLPGWGNDNTFSGNDLTVNAAGYGFNVASGSTGNVVRSDNTVRGAAKGTANVPLQ